MQIAHQDPVRNLRCLLHAMNVTYCDILSKSTNECGTQVAHQVTMRKLPQLLVHLYVQFDTDTPLNVTFLMH